MIVLEEKTYIKLAMKFASESKWRTSLLYFSKCDCYESYLNRLLLLMNARESWLFLKLLNTARCKFQQTHNLFGDLNLYSTELWRAIIRKIVPDKSLYTMDKSKISANPSLILDRQLFEFIDDDEGFSFREMLDILQSEDNGTMFAVNSPEHYTFLHRKIAYYSINGEFEKAEKVKDEVLQLKTDYLPATEMKLLIYFQRRQFDKALEIAEKIWQNEDISESTAIFCMVTFITAGSRVSEVKRMLAWLLQRENLSVNTVEECMKFANDATEDPETAMDFFDRLSDDFLETYGMTAMQQYALMCANSKDTETACDTLIDLIRMLPEHFINRLYLNLLREGNAEYLTVSNPYGINAVLRRYCVETLTQFIAGADKHFQLVSDCVLALMYCVNSENAEKTLAEDSEYFRIVMRDKVSPASRVEYTRLCDNALEKLCDVATKTQLEELCEQVLSDSNTLISCAAEIIAGCIGKGQTDSKFVGFASLMLDLSPFAWAAGDKNASRFLAMLNCDGNRASEYGRKAMLFYKLASQRLEGIPPHSALFAFAHLFNVRVSKRVVETFVKGNDEFLTEQAWKTLRNIADEVTSLCSEEKDGSV